MISLFKLSATTSLKCSMPSQKTIQIQKQIDKIYTEVENRKCLEF